jgi:hypothetical protein
LKRALVTLKTDSSDIKYLVDNKATIIIDKTVKSIDVELIDKEEETVTNTYNITINTHGCEKSPEEVQKFLEKFINGIKEKGTNL